MARILVEEKTKVRAIVEIGWWKKKVNVCVEY